MKIAKTRKFLTLLCVFIVAIVFSFAFSGINTASAEISGSDYFSYVGRTYQSGDVVFKEDTSTAVVKLYGEDYPVSIVNKLDLSDFAVSFYLPDVESFTVRFATDSYYKTGNKTVDEEGGTEYRTSVNNDVVFKKTGTSLTAAYNGGAEVAVSSSFDAEKLITVYTATASDSLFLTAKVNYDGNNVDLPEISNEAFLINPNPALIGKVSFIGAESELKIESVNQKYSAGNTYETNNFVQDFAIENGAFKNKADAKVYLPDAVYDFDSTTSTYRTIYGYKYGASLVGYSFLGFSSSEYKAEAADDSVKIIGNNLAFVSLSSGVSDLKTVNIKKGDKVVNSFGFNVINYETDETAPTYVDYADNSIPRDSFEAYVKGLIAGMGDSKEITIEKSKLSSLVSDDYSGFDLMSATLYYWSDNNNGSSSSLKLSLKDAGHYRFIILFTDYSGNAMEQAQFFYKDATDSTVEKYGIYKDYIFEFDIEDDTDLAITVGTAAGTGYKGVDYSCSAFTIDGNDYTVKYNLYYSATEISADGDGWQQIVAASEATDEDETYGAFTYSDIKNINYDGTLGFTPDRVGYYKFTCEVDSTLSAKSDSASFVFEVKEQVKKVTPDTHWLENNVWSVVFLSVGTLSLIGIIVLLFIKPKDEDNLDK